jgi:hypothetical protein
MEQNRIRNTLGHIYASSVLLVSSSGYPYCNCIDY